MPIHITLKARSLTIKPTTKYELRDIIWEEIKRQDTDVDLNHIDTSLITDMSMLFGMITIGNINSVVERCVFHKVDQWNVSNVTNMRHLFCGCLKFNCDLSKWDVSNVKYHRFMFDNCHIDDAYKPKFK